MVVGSATSVNGGGARDANGGTIRGSMAEVAKFLSGLPASGLGVRQGDGEAGRGPSVISAPAGRFPDRPSRPSPCTQKRPRVPGGIARALLLAGGAPDLPSRITASRPTRTSRTCGWEVAPGHAPARTRTENPLIKSQLLCRLSYGGGGTVSAGAGIATTSALATTARGDEPVARSVHLVRRATTSLAGPRSTALLSGRPARGVRSPRVWASREVGRTITPAGASPACRGTA